MAISLTPAAATHVQTMLLQRGKGIGLRVGIKKSGCSGYSYVVDYADEIAEQDVVFPCHGVQLVVDRQSLPTLDGMEIDFVTNNILHRGFEFHNPNVSDLCGCGESFSVD
jgi:iron-sulfur cluster assembly protein